MANKDYIERLQLTIQHLHKCAAVHRETVPVHEVFKGQTLWNGNVEVFDLSGHPKAKRCYGWTYGETMGTLEALRSFGIACTTLSG